MVKIAYQFRYFLWWHDLIECTCFAYSCICFNYLKSGVCLTHLKFKTHWIPSIIISQPHRLLVIIFSTGKHFRKLKISTHAYCEADKRFYLVGIERRVFVRPDLLGDSLARLIKPLQTNLDTYLRSLLSSEWPLESLCFSAAARAHAFHCIYICIFAVRWVPALSGEKLTHDAKVSRCKKCIYRQDHELLVREIHERLELKFSGSLSPAELWASVRYHFQVWSAAILHYTISRCSLWRQE